MTVWSPPGVAIYGLTVPQYPLHIKYEKLLTYYHDSDLSRMPSPYPQKARSAMKAQQEGI